MSNFKFIENVAAFKPESSYFAMISSEVNTKEELLRELSIKLKLPGYFGFNWDALYDCLIDFHWIEERRVVLLHTELPKIGIEHLRTYIKLLYEAVQSWKGNDEHFLEVVFPESLKDQVNQLVSLC